MHKIEELATPWYNFHLVHDESLIPKYISYRTLILQPMFFILGILFPVTIEVHPPSLGHHPLSLTNHHVTFTLEKTPFLVEHYACISIAFSSTYNVPLNNRAWNRSFAIVKFGQRALAKRGWNPMNCNLMMHPEDLATIVQQQDEDGLDNSQINVDHGHQLISLIWLLTIKM